jgi:hypothetical protein
MTLVTLWCSVVVVLGVVVCVTGNVVFPWDSQPEGVPDVTSAGFVPKGRRGNTFKYGGGSNVVLALHNAALCFNDYGRLCGNPPDENETWTSVAGIKYVDETPYVAAGAPKPKEMVYPCEGFNWYGVEKGPAWPTYGAPDGGSKTNFSHDSWLCASHRASDVTYRFPVRKLGLVPGRWYTFVIVSHESKWAHGFKHGGCGGCQGGLVDIAMNGEFIGRYDRIALEGLKGQWTELAIPFQIKPGWSKVEFSTQMVNTETKCPCHYPLSICGVRIHDGAEGSMWDRTGGMADWMPQRWLGSTWLYAINVGASYLQQPDGLLWSQDYGTRFPPQRGYGGDVEISYGTAAITCGSDYNYPLGCTPAYVGSLRGIDPWVWNWARKNEYPDTTALDWGVK